MKAFLRKLLGALFQVHVSGYCPSSKKMLIVANHESFIDGLLLGLFLPVNATFVVHTQIVANPFFRFMLKLVPYFAVDPTSPLAIKTIVRLVESGTPVVIFPEGRITVTGSLMKVFSGAAFVAAKTGADVIPVRLDGPGRTYFSRLSGLYPRHLLPRIRLSILPATKLEMPVASSAKERRRLAGEGLRRIMQEMIFSTRAETTLFGAFLDATNTFGRGYRLVEDVRLQEESYGSLLRLILGCGRVLSKRTAVGENVGVLLPNVTPTIGIVFGLSAFGRVPAMLNYTSGHDSFSTALTAAQITTVVTSRRFVEMAKLDGLLKSFPKLKITWLEDIRSTLSFVDKLWLLTFAQWFPHWAVPKIEPTAPALVLFTSGSEGKPKGVVHSHASILANVAQVKAVADFSPADKLFVALPLFHSFGFTCGTVLPLVTGSRIFLYPTPLHYRIIPEVVYDRNCTVLFGTSTFLAQYGKYAHPYDFFRVRYVVAGAEKLSDAVRTLWFDKFGIRLMEGYGATETAPVIAVNTPLAFRRGSVGQLLPGMHCRLEPVPGIEGNTGLLQVSGPNVMLGYLKMEHPGVIEPAQCDIGPGWYNTGDIIEMDNEGYLFIRGRMKRFAKIAGEMVSLEVVERLAQAADSTGMHAAVSRPDAAKGEALVLYTTSRNIAREQLLAAAQQQGVSELAVPRIIRVVDAIPVLGTGKTDYVTLQREEINQV